MISLSSMFLWQLVRPLFSTNMALMIWSGYNGCQILHRRDSQHGCRRRRTATLTGLLVLLLSTPRTAYHGRLSPQPLILHRLRRESDPSPLCLPFLPQYGNTNFLVTLTTTLHLVLLFHSCCVIKETENQSSHNKNSLSYLLCFCRSINFMNIFTQKYIKL